MTTAEMIDITGMKEDVKGALLDLVPLIGGADVDWKTVAVTLRAITPVAERLQGVVNLTALPADAFLGD